MKRYFCDICGKEIPDKVLFEEKFEGMDNCRKGRFRIEYQRARLDSNGKVFGFEYLDTNLCEQCAKRLESAVWKELRIMSEENPEFVKTSKIPAEPTEIRIDRTKHLDKLVPFGDPCF